MRCSRSPIICRNRSGNEVKMSPKTHARKDFSPFFLPVHPGSPYFTRVFGVFFFLHFCKRRQKDGCFSLFLAWKKCSFGKVRIKKSPENPVFSRLLWRRGWDSNPCALSRKLISSQPRYDHFDTSPCIPNVFHRVQECKKNVQETMKLCLFELSEVLIL